MPLTTDNDPTTVGGVGKSLRQTSEMEAPPSSGHSPTSSDSSNLSGYDVVTSAASPHPIERPRRWDLFILFNIAIPILLVLIGVWIVREFGVAEAQPVPPPDTSRDAYLEALPATRVAQIRSLAETGRQLELVIDGTVVPYREAKVSSEVSGRVIYKSEHCEAGAIVKQGDVLMRIDPEDYKLELTRLTQQREREYLAIGEVDQEMVNARKSIELAREDVRLQQKEVDRQQALQRFASDAEVDRAKGALLQSSQQLVILENQVDLLRSRRSKLEASEQLAVTQLTVAELNLRRCEIKAPISGVIVSEQADLNTFVNRGTALVTIEDTNKVEVAASMRMDQLHWVLDQDHSIQRDGYDLPDTEAIIEYEVAGRKDTVHRWKGTLVSYDGIGIDPRTRTVPVRLLVNDPTRYVNDDGKLQAAGRTNALVRGMFVRVRLLLKPQTNLVVIPARALRPGNRVWKFSADDTVLDAQMAADKIDFGKEDIQFVPRSELASQPDDTAGDEHAFDSSAWTAGIVSFSKSVYPIQSLRLSGVAKPDPLLAPSLQTIQRDWVCEADESDLTGGDYVVVSPLDSVPTEGLPARAEITQ